MLAEGQQLVLAWLVCPGHLLHAIFGGTKRLASVRLSLLTVSPMLCR